MSPFADQLRALRKQPEDAPMGMPGAFYTDAAQFEHEASTVLRRNWHCLGRVDEIPNGGDFFTVQLLDEPILVVRGDDEVIRAFANVCRHRGMPLAEGSGSAKRFVCAYHAWTYGHDGALLRAPRMENAGLKAEDCGLHQHNLQIWNGFIYVNLDPNAAEFAYPELDDLLSPYAPGEFRLVHVADETWNCNWKCLVENFMEGYHLSVVHPQTLHGYTPTGLSKKLVGGMGYTSYAANYPNDIAPRGHGAPGLTELQRNRSSLFSVFPTQVASQAASLLVSLCIFPVDSGRIQVKWTMSTYGDDLDYHTINHRIRLWEEVNAEDRDKLERLQQALGSKFAQPGPLAGPDYEGTIRDFHLWLAAQD